jgi:kumamolisin
VPDVSLEADPNRGYAIRFGSWNVIGGTSCAAPLWAAFTALVNQQRAAAGLQPVGFLNPTLYTLSAGSTYATDFHDIADFSTNGFYPASPVFDDATGLGTFNGAGLLADLSSNGGGGGTGGTGQLLGNPGFENGSDPSPWIATSGIVTNRSGEPAHSGTWKAWLGGTGSVNSQVLYQQVAIPKTVTKATLSFWLHVDTVETSRLANDTLTLQVRSQSGALLRTLTTFSNTTVWSGFRQESFNLLPYKGQTIRITLVGVENGTRATSFVLDDFALDVQ